MLNETTPGCSWLCCSPLSGYDHVKTSGSNTPPHRGQPEERLSKRKSVTSQGLKMSAFFDLELPFFWRQKAIYKPEDSCSRALVKGSFPTANFRTKFVASHVTRHGCRRVKKQSVDTKASNFILVHTVLNLPRYPHLVISTASTNREIKIFEVN